MKRILVALGLLAFSTAGCTLTAEDLTIDTGFKKIVIDKDTALAYTEAAMKQAGISAAAVTGGVPASPASPAARLGTGGIRPLYKKFAVTADQCVQYTDVACTTAGVCSYTEDYTACGNDFKGKITRTFGANYADYKITIAFDNYAEKPSTDTGHWAFNGKSSLDGTLGFEAANLALHTDGDTTVYLDGRLVHMSTSLTMNFKVDATGLVINGTQSGTITESKQNGTITVTDLTFPNDCAQGPAKGSVKTLIDGIETVTVITGCGKGTVTVGGGEAAALDAAAITKTFAPDIGGEKAEGFTGITEGTSGGSLLSGDWEYSDVYNYKKISLYEFDDGSTWIYFYNAEDNYLPQDGLYGDGDSYFYASGTYTYTATDFTATWDSIDAFYSYSTGDISDDVNSCGPTYTTTTCPTEVIPYVLFGSDSLTIGTVKYTRMGNTSAAVGPVIP